MNAFDHTKLEVGDAVAYTRSYEVWRQPNVHHSTIERFTATQIITADGRRFRRKDGRLIETGNYRGKLIDPNGSVVVAARIVDERSRVAAALHELQRADVAGTREAMSAWLDRIAHVVESARVRLDAIGGGS